MKTGLRMAAAFFAAALLAASWLSALGGGT
jgi:hypothetical protein